MRLRGHYLAIASLGFAVITYQVLINWENVTQGVRGIYGIMPPVPNTVALFYLVAGIAALVYLLLDNLVRSPVGDTLRAIREDEVSAASLGVNGAVWKAFAFGLGAAIAGLAGIFYPGFVGTLVPDAFGIIESFTMMAMVIVGGMGTMIGPVIGAIVLTFLPELLRGFGELRLMIYGLALTLVVLFMPGGIVQAWLHLRKPVPVVSFLVAERLNKSFGGVRAVQNVSIAVPRGRHLRHHRAERRREVDAAQPALGHLPARLRFASFQSNQSHRPSRSPARAPRHGAHLPEDPALQAAHAPRERARRLPHAPGRAALEVLSRRRRAAAFRAEALELLAFVGLGKRANDRAGALPYGQQRMLEIARALATRPKLFMLDEPAAGLNSAEVDFLLRRLESINKRDITVLVVEHNMDLVMNVAQRVFVMDHGVPLFEGTPREVQANPRVIEAYLGGEFAA